MNNHRRTADELTAEIALTREQLGETVQALAAKTDVKARAQDRIETVRHELAGRTGSLVATARQVTPTSAAAGGRQLSSTARAKPLPFAAAAAFAIGLAIGLVLRHRGDGPVGRDRAH
ncbi:MAG: DUF3618 domain-containing protein [Trebonia sp.]